MTARGPASQASPRLVHAQTYRRTTTAEDRDSQAGPEATGPVRHASKWPYLDRADFVPPSFNSNIRVVPLT
jgi:hypothetical protein